MKVDSNDGEVSEWNEAVFKMKRLHELQTEINRVKMDLLSKHDLKNNLYNYEVWLSSIDALYSEGQAKYKPTEITELDNLKKLIEMYREVLPVHTYKVKDSYSCNNKVRPSLIIHNWKALKNLIDLFESKVKYYNDKHGLSTKNAESMDGRSILR